MYEGLKISVVVPAYNEETLLPGVLETIPGFVDFIVVVDDFSSDRTSEQAMKFVSHDPQKFHLIRHERNMGVGGAVLSGHRLALELGADVSCVMAGDGQMDPSELKNLLKPIVDGRADYSKGNRMMTGETRSSMPPLRVFGNSILSLMTKFASGYWSIIDPQNGYTAVTKKCLSALPLSHVRSDYLFENDLLIHLNVYNFRVIDINMKAKYGKERSKIKTLDFMLKALFFFTSRFFWRLKEKYIINDFHPVVFFYAGGLIMVPMGLLSGLYILMLRMTSGYISAGSVIIPSFFTIIGLQFILFAMLFDRDNRQP